MSRYWGRHGARRADPAAAPVPGTGTVKVLPPPPGDTVTFDVPGSWAGAGPLPKRTPGARRPPARGAGPDLTALQRVRDSLTAMGQTPPMLPESELPVPSFIYPPIGRDPGPREYARLMRRVSKLTGTTSSYDDPAAWPAQQLTSTTNGGTTP